MDFDKLAQIEAAYFGAVFPTLAGDVRFAAHKDCPMTELNKGMSVLVGLAGQVIHNLALGQQPACGAACSHFAA